MSERLTFEKWWKRQEPEKMWDKTWANVSAIELIARKAWTAGYRQHSSDLNRALQNIRDGE